MMIAASCQEISPGAKRDVIAPEPNAPGSARENTARLKRSENLGRFRVIEMLVNEAADVVGLTPSPEKRPSRTVGFQAEASFSFSAMKASYAGEFISLATSEGSESLSLMSQAAPWGSLLIVSGASLSAEFTSVTTPATGA